MDHFLLAFSVFISVAFYFNLELYFIKISSFMLEKNDFSVFWHQVFISI